MRVGERAKARLYGAGRRGGLASVMLVLGAGACLAEDAVSPLEQSLRRGATSAAAPKGFSWPETPSLNFYGVPGTIDMPNAEMLPDAQYATTVAWFAGQSRFNLTFQALPWLNASFRYNGITNKNPDELLFGFDTYYDRGFDVRARLWREGRIRPAFTIGLQDFAGTGVFAGEYLVATKNFDVPALGAGQARGRLRVSAGLGWGRFGSFGSIGTIGTRGSFTPGDTGGELSYDQWFRGDVAPFASLEWQVNDRLGLKAEYSSDAYRVETQQAQAFRRRSSFNFGAEYQASRQLRLGAYYLYGSEFGVSAQLQFNPRHPPTAMRVAAPYAIVPRSQWATDEAQWAQDWSASKSQQTQIRNTLAEAIKAEGLVLEAVTLGGTVAEVRYRNARFTNESIAIGRIARAMTRTLPASVETFRIVPMRRGLGLSVVEMRRSDLEALEFSPEASDAIWAVTGTFDAGPLSDAANYSEELYPAWSTSITPFSSPSYFDPSVPLRLDVGVDFNATYQPAPGWVIAGKLRQRVAGNVAGGRESNSVLPRVRTDQNLYAQYGTTLEQLYASRFWQPGRSLYARATAGYLESMYAGLSGEILWKPVNSRVAFGFEGNYLVQREFDQRFGLRDYDILTGHASAYLELGRNYTAQVDVGRYLAGDYGGTFTLTRAFNNGFRVGGFFTLTNVSAEDFGEGSFDKGLMFSIPTGWLLGRPSRNRFGMLLRPIQRDGGQRVSVPGRLYGSVRDAHRSSLQAARARFWE